MSQSPQASAASRRYNDGWRAVNELIRSDGSWSGRERNTCYRNSGGGAFADISFVSGLDFPDDSRAFAIVDFDHDGDLDLILKSRTGPQVRVLRNESLQWRSLQLLLEGSGPNRDAIGARVTLQTSSRRMIREIAAGSSYLTQHSRRAHFGLLDGERVESIEVRWPDGSTAPIVDPPQSGLARIHQSEDRALPFAPPPPTAKAPASEPVREIHGTWLVTPVAAPDFTLPGLNGASHTLSGLKGSKVLLTFWATWCPPCRGELREFHQSAAQLAAAGVKLLAVSVDEPGDEPGDEPKVRQFARELNLDFPIAHADARTVGVYSVLNRYLFDRRRDLGIPTSFLLSPEGKIVKVYVGPAPVGAILDDARSMKGAPTPFDGRRFTPAPSRNFLDLATALAERGYQPEAAGIYSQALEASSPDFQLLTNYGTLLLEQEQFAEAERLLTQSLALNPDQVEAKLNLATLLVRTARPGEALPLLDSARSVYPDDPAIRNTLGTAQFQLEDPAAAEVQYREAIRLAPENAEYQYNLGTVLASTGRPKEAIEAFNQSAQLGRSDPTLFNNLGVLYMQTGNASAASQAFERALTTDPGDYGTHLNLALFAFETQGLEQGLAWLKKAQVLNPQEPQAFLIEAQAMAQSGEPAKARTILEALLQRDPSLEPAKQLLKSLE